MLRQASRERAKQAWRRLRGGELTPWRAAASVALGLAIGVTPLWGFHWLIVLAICVPLRLDAGVAFLASNISLPFIAPFITFAELSVGSRMIHGTWLSITPAEVHSIRLSTVLADILLGTFVVALGASLLGGTITHLLVSRRRRSRVPSPTRP